MAYPMQLTKLSRIYLDNINPRHDPIENEKEIISHLLAQEDIKPLAKHIAQLGGTSPLELVGVIPHPKVKGAYISAEGNRRVCALKLLSDPDKADTEVNKRYFRALKDHMEEPLVSVNAVIFPDRGTARPWVSLRHEGQQGGVGAKPWGPQQKARFDIQGGAPSNPDTQATLLVDYARTNRLVASEDLDRISTTTLTRFLSNPVFRDVLGLRDNRSIVVTVPVTEFNIVLARFLSDALKPGSGVNSRTTVEQRRAYANKLRKDGIAPASTQLEEVDLSKHTATKAAAKAAKNSGASGQRRNNRSRDQDAYVVPRDFKASIRNRILKRLFDELKDLPAENFPFCAAYLVRGVIEYSATLYLKQKGLPVSQDLHQRLGALATQLKKDGMSDQELKSLRTMSSNRDHRYSADTLGAFVHGGAIPTKVDSIKAWDSVEVVLTKLFADLK